MSIYDRIARLLFIVPYVVQQDGVPLEELADKLHISTHQLEADLELLSLVGKPPLTPDHLIDLFVEDGVVYVELHQSLLRPLRLTHEEARALVLAAKLVGNLGGLGGELEAALKRITEVLNPVDREIVQTLSTRIGLGQEENDLTDIAHILRVCISEHVEIEMAYYSASSDAYKTYRLQPLALLSHLSIDYLIALDTQSEHQEKLFRLDRIGLIQRTENSFTPPHDFDLERFRTQRLYFGKEELVATVQFSPRMAPMIAERFGPSDLEYQNDGSVRVKVSTSSQAWLLRWVLGFGPEAEVIEPAEMRTYIADFCKEAAQADRKLV